MRRARPHNGALALDDADYVIFGGGLAATPETASAVGTRAAAVMSAASRPPWAARQRYLNFTETSQAPARFWSPAAYDRLRRIKASR